MTEHRRSVVAFLPNGSEIGGIQRFSRNLVQALNAEQQVDLRLHESRVGGRLSRLLGRLKLLTAAICLVARHLNTRPENRPVVLVGHLRYWDVALVLSLGRLNFAGIVYGRELELLSAWCRSRWSRADYQFMIAISEQTAEWSREQRWGFRAIHIVDLGLPAGWPVRAPTERDSSASLHVLVVGRLQRGSERKNVDAAIEAVLQHCPNSVRLTIVGDGDDRTRLELLARRMLQSDRDVCFVGTLSDTSLKAMYETADVLCFPSTQEGFGLVALEGWAAGLAVVAADSRALRGTTNDGEAALLVPPEPQSLGSALSRLAGDEARRIELAKAGQELLQRRFSFDAFGERVASLVTQLAASG